MDIENIETPPISEINLMLTKIFASKIKGLTYEESIGYIRSINPNIDIYIMDVYTSDPDFINVTIYENENEYENALTAILEVSAPDTCLLK